MHYFVIAGEASGDIHGGELIAQLRKADPTAQFTYLGGDLMAAAAGKEPVIHYREMAYMAFSEVLRHLGDIRRNMSTAKKALKQSQADALILIDYPSFNLRVAEYAKKLGVPVYYFISPKVWAWKEWRVKKIKRLVKRILSILPFEVQFYRDRHGMEVDYVGNPSVEEVDRALAAAPQRADFLEKHKLRDRKIVALVPGSRKGEIKNNLPIMVEAMKRFPQYRGVVAGAPGIDCELYKQFTDLPVIHNDTFALLRHAHAALVTSGTATLETALARVPQVVLYRANGSKLAYKIMSKLIKCKFISLPNLIADREIIPEMILHMCTPDTVAEKLEHLLPDNRAERIAQLDGYDYMRQRLGTDHAATRAAQIIVDDLANTSKG